MTANPGINPPFDRLAGQPLVARYLSSAVEKRLTSHAYLFVGPIGAGKNEAALALAKALACKQLGCGSCDDCIRVARQTHPDVKVIDPEGAAGYVSEQIHQLIHDTNLAPIRAQNKVYIITRADLLGGAVANAFLKTLEEPPSRVVFILLARTRDSVLETLVSRCQAIAFRSISEGEAVQLLIDSNQVTAKEARIALASTGGSAYRAREYLGSSARRNSRIKVIEALERLAESDPLDVLESSRELLIYLKQPLDEVKSELERQLVERRDYLSKGALTALEQQQKRTLTARERDTIVEALNIIRAWLRDCILVQNGDLDGMVNGDFQYHIVRTAGGSDVAAVTRAIKAVDQAERQIHYNVSVQSAIEALFFRIRAELAAAADAR